jgi:class 3 adenylate cyclase
MGMDHGQLVRIKMNRQREYVGRPLNVAARLQAAIKDHDSTLAGKLLISKPAYRALGLNRLRESRGKEVTRTLRNISNGDRYRAMKITIYRER